MPLLCHSEEPFDSTQDKLRDEEPQILRLHYLPAQQDNSTSFQKNPLPDCWQGTLLSGVDASSDVLTLKQGVCTLPASLDCLKSGLSIIWIASPLLTIQLSALYITRTYP